MKLFKTKWGQWTDLSTGAIHETRYLLQVPKKALRKTAVSRWVSVKDELPKENGIFLTFTKNKVSESIGFTLFMDGQFMSRLVTH